MQLKPLSDWMIVRPVQQGRQTKGGLYIPDTARANAPYGYAEVLFTGPGAPTPMSAQGMMTVKPGDIIMIPKNRGEEMPIYDEDGNEETVLIIREREVLCIVPRESLPKMTSITGLDGKPLPLNPQSTALPDQVYKNLEDADRAERAGWIDPSDGFVDHFKPGDAPDPEDLAKIAKRRAR